MAKRRQIFNISQLPDGVGGGVTSVATGTGLTGGPITTTGSISLTGQALSFHNLASDGIIYRSGATIGTRVITGSAFITVTNGDGSAGNPTISFNGLNLDGLSDVIITTPSNNQVLLYNGTNWVNGTSPGGSGTVTQVDTGTGLTGGPITTTGSISLTGQALALHNIATNGFIYRNDSTVGTRVITGSTFINVTNSDGSTGNPTISLGTFNLNDLSDTIITAPANGQVLLYNGVNWVNGASPGGGGGTVTQVNTGTGLTGGPITTTGTISVVFGTGSGTVAEGNDSRFHNPVTLGTANGLSLSTQVLSLGLATTDVAGAMSTTDKVKLDGLSNYTHPAYTPISETLSGATVLSTFSSDDIGSVTTFTTRSLTPGDIGAESSFNKGDLIEGIGISISGSGIDRLVGDGDVKISATGVVQVLTTCANITINSDTDIYAFLDTTSGPYNASLTNRQILCEALTDWYNDYKTLNPGYTGNLYIGLTSSERYVSYLSSIRNYTLHTSFVASSNWLDANAVASSLNAPPDWGTISWVTPVDTLILAFVNESNPEYHGSQTTPTLASQPFATYNTDYNNFTGSYNAMTNFAGIIYPAVNISSSNPSAAFDRNFLLHTYAVLNNITPVTSSNLIEPFGANYTSSFDSVNETNPYVTNNKGLWDYNWMGILNKGVVGGVLNFTSQDFEDDLNSLLVTSNPNNTSVVKSFENQTLTLRSLTSTDNSVDISLTSGGCIDFQITPYTNTDARNAISLTTTGNSGASTYTSGTGVFNIPDYTLAGLGGVPTTRTISTNNGITGGGDLSIDRTFGLTGQALSFHNLASDGIIYRSGGTIGARVITAGTGISVVDGNGANGNPTITNTGVTSIVAGTGITISGGTGAVTINSSITQYTNTDARNAISLTTTGNSGASTYTSGTGVFNIPNYTLAGLGGEPAFSKGSLIQGTGITLSGTLSNRLVGTGDITIATSGGGTTTNSVTFNNGGAGAVSGTAFNGSSAVTVSYNTVGAPSTTGTNASGTWPISISGFSVAVASGTISDLNSAWTLPGSSIDNGFYIYRYSNTATNKPVTFDNANWLMNLYSHPSEGVASYGHQLAGADNDTMYFRNVQNGSFGSWRTMFHSGNGSLQAITNVGSTTTNSVSILNPGNLSFGSQTRQMINLWGTEYGIGVQSSTTYFRAGSAFAWFRLGSHSDTQYSPGSGGSLCMWLDNNSNLSVAADVITFASSDKRLKNNLTKINAPLEKLSKINGYSFDWNSNQETYTGHDYGVVAQEIEAIFPELVKTRDNGYKAVKYEKLIPLLIEAIKELNKKIDKLENNK
jgi:hypothetical protein